MKLLRILTAAACLTVCCCAVRLPVVCAEETSLPDTEITEPQPHEHLFEEQVIKEPTCTESGEYYYKCACGEEYYEYPPALGHTPGEWIVDQPAKEGVTGKRHKECTVCGEILEEETIPALAVKITSCSFSYTRSYTYTSKAISPTVTVKYNGKTLVKNKDYTVSYSNNVNVGTAKITVKGKGDFTGTKPLTFSIKAPTLAAPKNFSNTLSVTNSIRLEWKKAASVSGYVIHRYDSKTKKWVKISQPAQSVQRYSDKNRPAGTEQKYRICSYKKIGWKYFYSGWVYANASTTPAAVKDFRQKDSSATADGYTMVWSKVTGADRYAIYRYDYSACKYVRYKTVKGTSLKITGVQPGARCAYKIVAEKVCSQKTYTSQSVKYKFTAKPAKTLGFKVKDTDRSKVKIGWQKTSNATGYQIYYSSSKNGTYKLLKSVGSGSATEYTLTNLPKGKAYYLKIRAVSRTPYTVSFGNFSAPVKARAFNNKSYESVISSYTNRDYLTSVNAQGYKMSAYAKNRLHNSLRSLGGTASFVLLDLDSGALIGYNANTYLGTASTVKMPYMLYCLNQMEDGSPSMNKKLTFKPSDASDGSSLIKSYPFGTKFTIKQCMQYIFDYSDNCGYYMLQDEFGISGYNKFISSLGCRTSVGGGIRWGVVSAADSAREWIQMYDYLYNGRYADFVRKGFANSTSSNFRIGLNYKYPVYSKCGWTDYYHHDTAVIEAEHPYVLVCLTNRVSAYRLQEVARAADYVHDEMWAYYNK